MLKDYKNQLENFLKNKIYMICLIAIAILTYGFSATNITVGIDDLESGRYIGEQNELLAAGRFAWLFWTKIFGMKNQYVENNFVFEAAGVILFMWAAINLCILFKKAAMDKISMSAYTLFSCLLISYPLMNEIWEYTGVNIVICGNILFVSFALLLLQEALMTKFHWQSYVLSSLMMMIVCAGYESVAVVFVFLAFSVLFLQSVFGTNGEENVRTIVKQGLFYAGALITGVVLRIVVHKILLMVTGISAMSNGDTSIWWGVLPVGQIIGDILRGIIKEYLVKGIIYFPITELIISIFAFIIICVVLWKKVRNKWYCLPAVGMLLSLILLTLIQGRATPYRTCQVFAFFVAFIAMLVVNMIKNSQIKLVNKFYIAVIIGSGLLCIHQASTMNYYFTMNHLRSEEEARVICDIGEELSSKYDLEKPVIFAGTFDISDDLKQRVMIDKEDIRWKLFSDAYGMFSDKDIYNGEEFRKLPNSNVNSVIKWGMTAFGSQDGLWKLFKHHGFEYKPAFYSLKSEAETIVEEKNIPNYPKEGYIYETDDYIIVNMY